VSSRSPIPGVYDQIVSEALGALLDGIGPDHRAFHEELGTDREAASHALARLVHDRVIATLRALPSNDEATSVERQVALTNSLLAHMEGIAKEGVTLAGDHVRSPARRLTAIVAANANGLTEPSPPVRPEVPLSTSDLLVNGRRDLRIGTEVARELASADSVDLLCSFLKWSGFLLIEPSVREFLTRRPKALRVLTTAYMGATERRALDALAELGAQVRVSYDTEGTRLHAKAWFFHRHTGFSTAYVGSSNLSHAAMHDGTEWNVRLSKIDNRAILEKFERVFEQYWSEGAFETYDPARDASRWDAAVRREVADRSKLLLAIHVEPKPHQVEALERLEAERERGHTRNLIVAATGTGKTFIAAFDYKALSKRLALPAGRKPSLLFVAHRHEILEQSQTVFRVVLGDAVFGERLGNGEVPRQNEHVFANIQSLHAGTLEKLSPDAFDIVIVDEFHHAASKTYDTLLHHLKPKFLIGLTATPERNDGQSVLEWFEGRIAAELRLWKALDQGLLSPFQYFGVSDGTNLRGLKWSRAGYDTNELRNVYTANDLWIKRVLQEVNHHVADPTAMRALGFCVDIAHAEFVAQRFNEAGLASVAVSQKTSSRERANALARLQSGDLRAVFSVDLLNEGVDVPDVDTVLFLRPTESATVFLQQLGRGLRRRPDKDCLTVLDFIGGAHRNFRYDARFRAILGGTRQQIVREIERGFPRLPSGCSIQLDRIAAQTVIDNIRESLGRGDEVLVDELRALGRDVSLAELLRETGLDLDDVYSRPGRSLTRLRRRAGLATRAPSPSAPSSDELEVRLERALARLLHVDDPVRLSAFSAALAQDKPPSAGASDPLLRMLFVALGWMNRSLDEMPAAWAELWATPAIRGELLELFAVLEDTRGRSFPLQGRLANLALQVHATYGLDEVMAALDERTKTGTVRRLREGIFHWKAQRADLLFVTLDKSEADYSPTTMYRDYAISARRFHWESQSGIHADTETGRRYIEHAARAHEILLFVRQARFARPDVTAPYTFLGPARYVRHEGARPMAIEWELEREMPAWLFQEVKVAAG
jgi:superfamily II DNA or RNA helicase/HKD family nuclease